jgi:hypothetical protein
VLHGDSIIAALFGKVKREEKDAAGQKGIPRINGVRSEAT